MIKPEVAPTSEPVLLFHYATDFHSVLYLWRTLIGLDSCSSVSSKVFLFYDRVVLTKKIYKGLVDFLSVVPLFRIMIVFFIPSSSGSPGEKYQVIVSFDITKIHKHASSVKKFIDNFKTVFLYL